DFGKRLNPVHVVECLRITAFNQRPDLLHRLNRANLIVYMDRADEDGLISQRPGELIQVYVALPVYRKESNLETFFFKLAAAVEDRRVFNLRGYNMIAPAPPAVSRSFKRQVIGFGAA